MNDEQKRRSLARYEEQKHRGESFFPYTVAKDTLFALLVFLVLVALAVFAGAPLEEPANPANTTYVPRPEWYFMFLFQMLKYFPGELEWVGVVAVPGALLALMFFLPLLDRGPARHPSRRPLTLAATTLAMAAITFLTLQAYQITPSTLMAQVSRLLNLG